LRGRPARSDDLKIVKDKEGTTWSSVPTNHERAREEEERDRDRAWDMLKNQSIKSTNGQQIGMEKGRVIIVEDEENILSMLGEFLTDTGMPSTPISTAERPFPR
jgi:lactam utilization protein B